MAAGLIPWINFGAIPEKIMGNSAADILPGRDNVGVDYSLQGGFNMTPDFGTSAYAPGGSKYTPPQDNTTSNTDNTTSNTDNDVVIGGYGGGGGGGSQLDTRNIQSLQALIDSLADVRSNAITEAQNMKNSYINEKNQELEDQKEKYQGEKLDTKQDFGSTLNKSDLNARATLSNLLSAISTLGLSGGEALTRQIMAYANQQNQEANRTQAQNNRSLDQAFNTYKEGYNTDVQKIKDQYQDMVADTKQDYYTDKQKYLQKIAQEYADADMTSKRNNYMDKADALNSKVTGAAFTDPTYTGKTRQIETPDLASYNKNIAQYDTSNVGANKVGTGGGPAPVVKRVELNPTDYGIKKKQSQQEYGL